jgi:hypothetical protein
VAKREIRMGFDRLNGDGGMDTSIAAEVVADCEA